MRAWPARRRHASTVSPATLKARLLEALQEGMRATSVDKGGDRLDEMESKKRGRNIRRENN